MFSSAVSRRRAIRLDSRKLRLEQSSHQRGNMTWREVWDANLEYDLESNNVTPAIRSHFSSEVDSQFPPPPNDDAYLSVCDKVVRANPDRFLRQGRTTKVTEDTVGCVRTLSDLRSYNCHEDVVHRGESGDDLVHWYHHNFRPEFLRKSLAGRKPLLWVTLGSELDGLEALAENERGEATRERLGLEHGVGECYVRIDIPCDKVKDSLRAPTTFDGGPRSLFVAAADEEGWGRTCDPSNRFRAREAVSPPVHAESLNLKLLGEVRSEVRSAATPYDTAERARFIRERPRHKP
jgi:hypothetical protein